jgi:hypothetical protein
LNPDFYPVPQKNENTLMGKITVQTIVLRNPKMVTSNIDDEIVMMSVDNGEYYGLDEIGSRIWALLENPISVQQLISALMDEFEVEEETCHTDTLDFINDLFEKKLISIQ